jgi:hypothetical protein
MKIGGTGFNLSPAHFQKPTTPSDHDADFHRLLLRHVMGVLIKNLAEA